MSTKMMSTEFFTLAELEEDPMVVFKDRIDLSWVSLVADIDRWQKAEFNNDMINYHLLQFGNFIQTARTTLLSAYNKKGYRSSENRILLESLISGAFTSQWLILQEVAQQRLSGHPYCQDLADLDSTASDYYARLRDAMPDSMKNELSQSAPLVYLGSVPEIIIFPQSEAPTFLSIPIGAISATDAKTEHALPHEVGHAVFGRLEELHIELKSKLETRFLVESNMQTRLLFEAILNWLEEMIVDMVGVALEGGINGESAIWLTASIDKEIGLSDGDHPPALIRPYIHVEALRYLAELKSDQATLYEKQLVDLQKKLDFISKDKINHRFESIPALTIISLLDVREFMIEIINYILRECRLSILENMTIGEVLIKCALSTEKGEKPIKSGWGELEIAEDEITEFTLKLPKIDLEYGVPIKESVCRLFNIQFCINS